MSELSDARISAHCMANMYTFHSEMSFSVAGLYSNQTVANVERWTRNLSNYLDISFNLIRFNFASKISVEFIFIQLIALATELSLLILMNDRFYTIQIECSPCANSTVAIKQNDLSRTNNQWMKLSLSSSILPKNFGKWKKSGEEFSSL